MKVLFINLFILVVLLSLLVFFTSFLFLLGINWWGYVLVGLNIILTIFYPIRLGVIATIREYKYYRANRPVKILHRVNSKLTR